MTAEPARAAAAAPAAAIRRAHAGLLETSAAASTAAAARARASVRPAGTGKWRPAAIENRAGAVRSGDRTSIARKTRVFTAPSEQPAICAISAYDSP